MATWYIKQISQPIRLDAPDGWWPYIEERAQLGTLVIIHHDSKAAHLAVTRQTERALAKLARQRDHSLDADEKLRLTKLIAHLQSTLLTKASELVYLTPLHAATLHLRAIYTLLQFDPLDEHEISRLSARMNRGGMVIGAEPVQWLQHGGHPAEHLEQSVTLAWQNVTSLLLARSIQLDQLVRPAIGRSQLLDDALESLLDEHVAREFLQRFGAYRQTAKWAAPLLLNAQERKLRQTVAVLAGQVHTFNPIFEVTLFESQLDDPSYYFSDWQPWRRLVTVF